MRLIKLSANQETFNPIRFNRTGLSLILATQKVEDAQKTYNSTGKSLSIVLTHFCLGSNPIKPLEKKLPGWEFSLTFEINGSEYVSRRSTSKQNQILLNDTKYRLKDFHTFLFDLLFDPIDNLEFVSFRSLISRFIRYGRGSYKSATTFIDKEKAYAELINNTYLLGLDPNIVFDKYKLKKDLDDATSFIHQFEKKPEFQRLVSDSGGGKSIDINIRNLKDSAERLNKSLSSFVVAEDYHIIKQEADEFARLIAEQQNEITRLQNAVNNIETSLSLRKEVAVEKVLRLYEEAKVELPEMLKKNVQEVEQFHKALLTDRTNRLTKEKQQFEKQIEQLKSEIGKLGEQQSKRLQLLKGKGALDQYLALSQKLSETEERLQRYELFREITTQQKNKINEIQISLKAGNITANNYLTEQAEAVKDENISLFQSIVQQCYDDKSAGIEIENNEGINQIRFNINPYIDTDGGGGVNKVKIFCFDWTLLLAQHRHKVKFLWHDSLIFEGVDPRQRGTLLKYALEESEKRGFQYIIALNQDEFEAARKDLETLESGLFDKIYNRRVLELTDESDEKKLLGIYAEMNLNR
ncbi:MAG: DUF2326 domain-containing protein [Lewinellaceae bacterium]|nr:DUF2326 domain-containing protein [Saprospiraceae bacterium]MCB9340996.1 DUF2326 domain-containing protein [Lewinellaceae bacterium]